MKLLVPKFRSDITTRSKDIAEKQVTADLKLIVGGPHRRKSLWFCWPRYNPICSSIESYENVVLRSL